jgi:hypothetical protein
LPKTLRDEARLRALFERLLVVSAVASPLGCSTPDNAGTTDPGPSVDASAKDANTGAPPRDAGFADPACDPVPFDGGSDGSGCDIFMKLPCGLPPNTPTSMCYLELVECAVLCNQSETYYRVCAIDECLDVDGGTIPSTGPLTLECATGVGACGPGAGRRPEGFVRASPAWCGDAIGSALADVARLEAASVQAFRRLGSELTSMRAPRALVRAAERSARDEVRHARVMSRLARRHGAAPSPLRLTSERRARSLEAFALENAVEGCVRESFGALVATRQATHAHDPELAHAMGRIARDETRHAALAWRVARWIEPRLSDGARARVRRAIGEAFAALRCEVASTPVDVAGALGLPAGREGVALVDAFEGALFRSS